MNITKEALEGQTSILCRNAAEFLEPGTIPGVIQHMAQQHGFVDTELGLTSLPGIQICENMLFSENTAAEKPLYCSKQDIPIP